MKFDHLLQKLPGLVQVPEVIAIAYLKFSAPGALSAPASHWLRASPPPAQAGDTLNRLYGDLIAELIHHDDGDVFTVHDWHSDGQGVRGTLYIADEDGEQESLVSVYNGLGAAGVRAGRRDSAG